MDRSSAHEPNRQEGRSRSWSVPRWVKVAVLVAVALLLVVAGVVLFVPGEHGPSRHLGHAAGVLSSTVSSPEGGAR